MTTDRRSRQADPRTSAAARSTPVTTTRGHFAHGDRGGPARSYDHGPAEGEGVRHPVILAHRCDGGATRAPAPTRRGDRPVAGVAVQRERTTLMAPVSAARR